MRSTLISLKSAKAGLCYLLLLLCIVGFMFVQEAYCDPLDNWYQRGSGVTGEDLETVVHGNDTFIAAGASGALVSSDDGTTWTNVSSGTGKRINAMTYANNSFRAVGWDGAYLTSSDGVQWNAGMLATVNDFHFDIIYAGGLYAVVGYYNLLQPQGTVITSPDGTNWNVKTLSLAAYHYGITYGSSTYVIVGSAGAILTSPDGDGWTRVTGPGGPNLLDVCYADNTFILVGINGLIMKSDDGVSWIPVYSGTTKTLYAIRYFHDTWIAVGAEGTLLTSTSGDTWTARDSGTTSHLKSIAYGKDTMVVVGQAGTILQSDTFSQDTDNDGVRDDIEDGGPNGGDGNADGTLDSAQATVATFRDINGAFVTLVSEAGTEITGATATNCPSVNDRPESCTFPCGFFGFTVTGLTPGQQTTVTVLLHTKDASLNTYYKYGPTPGTPGDHWYEFMNGGTTGAEITQETNQTRIVLHFTDGATGDDDLLANEEITDVGAPGAAATGGDSGEGGGGGGGSCFISTATCGATSKNMRNKTGG